MTKIEANVPDYLARQARAAAEREHVQSKELTPGEAEFIDRRLQDHFDNPDDVVPLGEVKANLDAKYHR